MTRKAPRKLSLAFFGRRATEPVDDASASLLSGDRELNVPLGDHQLQQALSGDAAVLLSVQLCSAILDLCRRFECFFSGSGIRPTRVLLNA